MKAKLLLITFTLLGTYSFAQNFRWAKSIGGSNTKESNSIAIDASGNSYTVGNFHGTVDFDPGAGIYNLTSKAYLDIFISKLDASGNFVWAKNFGGGTSTSGTNNGHSIAIDSFGNVYTTGEFMGTIDFDPDSVTTYNLTSFGFQDIFISKLDSSGHFVWAKHFPGIGYSITSDKSGNVYTTGVFGGTTDFDPGTGTFNLIGNGSYDIFILKLDSSGNFVWAKNMGGTQSDYGYSIALDSAGNIYTTGSFSGTSDFNPGSGIYNLTAQGPIYSEDIFISKLNPSGDFIWAKRIGGAERDVSYSLAVQASGNVYIAGIFKATADFDPDTTTYNLTSTGGYDIFVAKLDSSGKFLWAKSVGEPSTDYAYSIALDNAGNAYITGYFYGTVDFNPGSGINNLTAAGLTDIFILKLNTSGNYVWAKRIGGSDYEIGLAITADVSGNIYVTGAYIGTVDFDPSGGTSYLSSISSSNYYDIFILMLCAPAPAAGSIFGPVFICEGATKTYSINPVANITNYYWAVPPGAVINSGQNSTSINVTFGKSSGNVSVTPGNSCGSTSTNSYPIILSLLPTVVATAYPSSTVCAGTQVTLSGTGAYTYSWSGGVTNGLSFVPSSTNTYIVTGTSTSGCINSDTITITVDPLPVISTQPLNQAAIAGAKVQFITASSNPLATYQWQKNSGTGFINLTNSGQFSGVTNDTLSISNVTFLQNNNRFRCIISNGTCSNISDTGVLTVTCILNFMSQPLNQTANALTNARFLIVSSSPTATYQWQQNSGSGFINLSNSGLYSGVNNDTLTINSVTLSLNNNSYRCIITENGCSDTSNAAILKVNCTLTITVQPLNKTVTPVSDVLFTSASSSPSSLYQWQVDTGTGFISLSNTGRYSGATNDSLIVKGVILSMDNERYRCIVAEGGCSDSSNEATLNVICNLTITTQPVNQTAKVNFSAQFIAGASSLTAAYQWQQNPGTGFINLSNSGQFAGVTNDTLTISNITASLNNYQFRCIITEAGCYDTTYNALLSVNTIGINKIIIENVFRVFPNPATSSIIIQSNDTPDGLTYTIIDETGRQLLNGILKNTRTTVDISRLVHGFYFVQVGESGKETFKLVKQ